MKDQDSDKESRMKIRLILGPMDSEGKSIVFVTNLNHKKIDSREEVIDLYTKRWGVETLYNRVKNLLYSETFHARSYNGVVQVIFANLLALSLAAVAVDAVV